MNGPKTVVFGLDGFDFEYAESLARAGVMPWLQSMSERGSLIKTSCVEFPGSEWVNAASGTDPAFHGYLHTEQLHSGTYETEQIDATVVQSEPFYVPIAKAGNQVVVVDLCVDRPRPTENLVQVIDWATEFKLYRHCTSPPTVGAQIPLHPLTNYGSTDTDETNLIALKQKLIAGTRLKGEVIRGLLGTNPQWSLLFAGFCEIHKAGHFFWKYQDESHADFRGDRHPLANALQALYSELDNQMQALASMGGEEANILLVADRGMRAEYRGAHLLEDVLVRLGLLELSNPNVAAPTMADAHVAQPGKPNWTSRVAKRLPASIKSRLRRLSGRQRINWDRTKAFKIPDVGNTYLRLNLMGREPQGIVHTRDYDALLDHIAAEFQSLTNPATGNRPVREVVFPHRTFRGPRAAQLPDIGFVWRDTGPIEALESASIGRVDGAVVPQRSGNHTEAGGMLVTGPSFRAGCRRPGDLRELAPTLYRLFDIAPSSAHQLPAMSELH